MEALDLLGELWPVREGSHVGYSIESGSILSERLNIFQRTHVFIGGAVVARMLRTSSIDDYRTFLRARTSPVYRIRGHMLEVPDEYAWWLESSSLPESDCQPSPFLFDYQAGICEIAARKKKFAVFADCGLGKTLILLDFVKHVVQSRGGRVLIVSPLMVVPQTVQEAAKFYGDSLTIQQIPSSGLQDWMRDGSGVGITNYDAMTQDLRSHGLSGLVLDESSMLKSHYGKWGQQCIELGRGVEYKLALTGTPAPNDRIEYANHAVFLDASKTVNEFLARYFVNRGQTDNRWEIKPHAIEPFYRDLSHWCIFLTNPATYGWHDNTEKLPPIHVSIDHVELSPEQSHAVQIETGGLFAGKPGGIGQRATLAQIGKGSWKGERIPTHKPSFIRSLVDSFGDESTIIWCHFNDEQKQIAEQFPDAANIDGSTQYETRIRLIDEFKSGQRKVLISKPKILGFGLNLQVCTRMVFSGLQDSYESYYQAVKRANRYGSTKPLYVHIPVTDIEIPMIETVLTKAQKVQSDTEAQERLFRSSMFGGSTC